MIITNIYILSLNREGTEAIENKKTASGFLLCELCVFSILQFFIKNAGFHYFKILIN
jgi:hypothetical protein